MIRALGDTYLERSQTRTWLHNASKRVIAYTPHVHRLHLLGRCACANTSELVVRSTAEGIVDLVFARIDPSVDVRLWPLDVNAILSSIQPPALPEVLRFDEYRILNMA